MSDRSAHLPGRLADPSATLLNDQRADPRIIRALELLGGIAPGVEPPGADASYEECLAFTGAFEAAAAAGNEALLAALPTYDTVERYTETITGVDGNAITLYVHRPKGIAGRVPCIVHTHGGGMVLMSATDPMFVRLRDSLADAGVLTIGVEFRNGGGRLGNHPFPAGLNDCASAVQWAAGQRDALGISGIVVSGESGGGNLAIATALKANREGWVERIDGIYAMCPYISGAYADPPVELLSLYENDGYLLSCREMVSMVKVYDPTGEHRQNPLAWPLTAQPGDLAGLPPHVVSVNELDPLRDEGLSYYRMLLRDGVSAVARTVHGTPHAGDLSFADVTPDLYQDTVRSLSGFAASVCR